MVRVAAVDHTPHPDRWGYLTGFPKLSEADHARGVIHGDNTPGYVWRVPWDCSPIGKHSFGCAGKKFALDTTALNL